MESPGRSTRAPEAGGAYLGFDRNEYPGDEAMATLRKQFTFVGFWLSPPPRETTNSWTGKREKLAAQEYGFVLLYAGRPESSLKNAQAGSAAGEADAKKAAELAKKEGFGIDKRQVQLPEPIKTLGDFPVTVKVFRDVVAQIQVHISKEA